MKKIVSCVMLALILINTLTIAFSIQTARAEPAIIIVPDDYLTIQEAVVAASPGDNIVVNPGVYHENVFIYKPLTIKSASENPTDTIIEAENPEFSVFSIEMSDYVSISGFTIKGATGWAGISLLSASNCSISNNIILNNDVGIELSGVMFDSYIIGFSENNTITDNKIYANTLGIILYGGCDNNKIYHNNFIDNDEQAYVIHPIANTLWDDGYPSGGNYWSDYTGVDYYSGPNQDVLGSDGIGDTPYIIDDYNIDHYPLMKPWTPARPIQTWSFDSDFQYNLDDNYETVEGTGHLSGSATLSDGTLSIEGQATLTGPLPSAIPEVYIIATDGQDKELTKKIVDLTYFSYWQIGPNTYGFSGTIPDAPQPINNGHYEVSALITYNSQKYQFFINTNSLINSHYLPLTTLPTLPVYIPTTIRVLMDDGSITTTNLEEYLKGVVCAEMGPEWVKTKFGLNDDQALEALKAQAIAARTYAVAKVLGILPKCKNCKGTDANVCTKACCQRWSIQTHPLSDRAVSDTCNMVITYQGKIIKALYFAHCDGKTRNNEDVWGGKPLPYLRSVKCDCGQTVLDGHGVGMCQWGAIHIAKEGYKYEQILEHYYTNVKIVLGTHAESLTMAVIHSSAELRVYDSKGHITGIVNGVVKEEIPNSSYDQIHDAVIIVSPIEPYCYEVAGEDEETYSLTITIIKGTETSAFAADDIHIRANAIHRYTIDWDALSSGGEGVTVMVDSDGDGVFEQSFTTGNMLTGDEFVLKTETTVDFDPDSLNLYSRGMWVTAYIEFPEGYDVADINVSSILLNGTVPVDPHAPWAIGDYDGDGVQDLMVKFNREQLRDYILANVNMTQLIEERFMKVTLNITGKLSDGTAFQGTTTITIILPKSRCGRLTQLI